MKTRELTADEVKIDISVENISNIIPDPHPPLPVTPQALEALRTGLSIRGRGMNIFVCGPSAPERTAVTLQAAGHMTAGECCSIAIRENPENPNCPIIEKNSTEKSRILVPAWRTPPVIIENNPVPRRLFGTDGSLSQINAGSLMHSNGGLLILNAEDLLEEEESWKLLKRILRTGRTVPGAIAAGAASPDSVVRNTDGTISPLLILPEIEVDLKVVILGNEGHFDHFYNTDEDFRELFQFFAEIDSVIEFNNKNLADTVNHLRNFSIEKYNRPLSNEAALEIIKYSVASAENNTKLSTIISELELLITEASQLKADGTAEITGDDIKTVAANQAARFSLLELRIIEDIKSGEINLRVEGSETGKVNGLAVIDKGSWAFGSPGLISARIAPGENGLVNIEHEAGLSGEIHDKWVLILEGYLRSSFAYDFPISIFASICFEQSYSEIDGDSASSSELYALLSAISGVPLRQDIAVTGSLSQTGEIQAVGGLREKIEGFYKACKAINFTGKQGVIVPERNIKNIILPDNIIEDRRNGQFHIYPVSTVDDSMEILTGREAGKRNSRGQFPHSSINSLIEKNLKKLASQAKNFGN